MLRYKLRTLLILMTVLPPLLARVWFTRWDTIAALRRMPHENWFSLLGVAVAIAVVVTEIARRRRAVPVGLFGAR
jgi:hypothetical protein